MYNDTSNIPNMPTTKVKAIYIPIAHIYTSCQHINYYVSPINYKFVHRQDLIKMISTSRKLQLTSH